MITYEDKMHPNDRVYPANDRKLDLQISHVTHVCFLPCDIKLRLVMHMHTSYALTTWVEFLWMTVVIMEILLRRRYILYPVTRSSVRFVYWRQHESRTIINHHPVKLPRPLRRNMEDCASDSSILILSINNNNL